MPVPGSETLLGRRVLVTGGHGFIGRHVVELLAEAGAHPVVPYRPGTEVVPDLPGDHVELDLAAGQGLDELLEGTSFVLHLAARSGGIQFQQEADEEIFDENRCMTKALLSAVSRSHTVSRIFAASSAVIYAPSQTPLEEDAPLLQPGRHPISGYAWSKITDEVTVRWAAASSGFSATFGRFSNVYGPAGDFEHERSTVIHSLVRKAVDARPGGTLEVWGSGRAIRSFIHVRDAARAVVAILCRGSNSEAYNIDTGVAVSIRDVATLVRNIVDPSLTVLYSPEKPSGDLYRVLIPSKVHALGVTPIYDLAAGIEATVADYRARFTPLGGRQHP